ncbi:MAG: cytochrome c4 [Gammaproteobacteria bacterium]|nr:cytochrome c4 [Gammaproteobacteria bacterium]NIR97499.1 cytochrome c4 [Gammaproteobacteria bacterium]NIT63137.1 cytochrome c4 [Gammaproteobacteria bacterium]NIV19256.1 c-type cytochrome [Gammaproteobacteria bacterium]NIX10246.1 c-type cytochrome [Gammaproteobacteria bacterium]
MNSAFAVLALVAALGVCASAQAAGDPAAGKEKAAPCAGCHGPDGNSGVPNFPKLAGQHESYLLKQLKEFKSGVRKNQIMSGQVAGLSEQDMADLAAFYAEQSVQHGKADPDLVDEGQKLYRGGNPASNVSACSACHGPTGAGNPAAKFPVLAGQHAEYTVAQLKAFREAGHVDKATFEPETAPGRGNDPGRMMQNIAVTMSDDEIEAVASYVQGLR